MLPIRNFRLRLKLVFSNLFGALKGALKNSRFKLLILFLPLLSFLVGGWFYWRRVPAAAAYRLELPKGLNGDNLQSLTVDQRKLLDEAIARSLRTKPQKPGAVSPVVVVLTQNNQPIWSSSAQQGGTGGTSEGTTPSVSTPTPTPTFTPSGPFFIEAEDLVDWAPPWNAGWARPCGNIGCLVESTPKERQSTFGFAYSCPGQHTLKAVVEYGPNRGSFVIQSSNPAQAATINLRVGQDFTFPTIDLLGGLAGGLQQITVTANGDGYTSIDKFILPAGCTREQTPPPSVQCTDSDNGKNYSVKGTTIGYYIDDRFFSLTDTCQSINPDGSNPDWVLEYHCETAGSTPQGRVPYISTSSFHCPNGCQDGACLQTPVTPPPPTCTDSDGGMNYYVKGTVNQTGDPLSPHTDYCTEVDGISWDKPYLIEYTCENDHWKMNTYDCPNGCQDGVCKGTPPSACTDSDGGKNYYVEGIAQHPGATEGYTSLEDFCAGGGGADIRMLAEAYCSEDGRVLRENYICPNGCENGACKASASQCTETDGGKNFYQKGTLTSVAGTTFTDYCLTGTAPRAMTEFWCKPGTIWAMEYFECPSGCQDGACKSGPPPVPPNFLSVSGASFLVSDVDNGQGNWQTAMSTCTSLGARLPTMTELNVLYQQKNNFGFQDEAYWSSEESGGNASYISFSNGFNNSISKDFTFLFYRCVKDGTPPTPTSQCVDSDGINYYTKGTLMDKNGKSYKDFCVKDQTAGADPNYLAEYACQTPVSSEGVVGTAQYHQEEIFLITYNCPNGCQDGACKGTPPPPPVTRGSPRFSLEGEAVDYYQDKNKQSLLGDILKIYQEVEKKFGPATKVKNLKIRLSIATTPSQVNYFNASNNELVLSPQNPPSPEELTGLLAAALYDEQVYLKPQVFAQEIKKMEISNVSEKVFGTPLQPESKAPAKQATPTPTPEPESKPEASCSSDWEGYVNQKLGFKLKIPPGWTDDSIEERQSGELIQRSLISTTRPADQIDPSYKVSHFKVFVSSKDFKTLEYYSTWFDNSTGNQKKSSINFKGLTAEKYVDETEVFCGSQAEENIKNCAHRFEVYYFKKDNLYYVLNIGLYLSADVKEKNEKTLQCFLDAFELLGGESKPEETKKETGKVPSGLKQCQEAGLKVGDPCNDLGKKPVCGYSKLVFDTGQSRVDVWDYANACFYCSQFDKTGFSELRGTKFYSLGFQEGVCQK